MFTHFFTLSSLEKAILATVAYVDQFDYPLTIDQVVERCLCIESGRDVQFEKKRTQVLEGIQELETKGIVERSGGYVVLKGRGILRQARKSGEGLALKKQEEVARVVRFCQRIPWVKSVFVTGSLAMGVATTRSDIDFMIVTAPRRVWLTRVMVSIFAQVHGRRRTWSREEPGSWCFNLWLDEDHLVLPKKYHDVYRAHEVVQANEVFVRAGRDGERSLKTLAEYNSWILDFFFCAGRRVGLKDELRLRSQQNSIRGPSFPFARWWDGVDWFAWRLQCWYMRRHRTIERVGRGFAFFHPRDTQRELYAGWLTSLEKVLIKKDARSLIEQYTVGTFIKRNAGLGVENHG